MFAPIVPLAPVRFSTTADWPSAPPIFVAVRRATRSSPGPGGNGTTTVIGFAAGHGCADAGSPGRKQTARLAAIRRRMNVIGNSSGMVIAAGFSDAIVVPRAELHEHQTKHRHNARDEDTECGKLRHLAVVP